MKSNLISKWNKTPTTSPKSYLLIIFCLWFLISGCKSDDDGGPVPDLSKVARLELSVDMPLGVTNSSEGIELVISGYNSSGVQLRNFNYALLADEESKGKLQQFKSEEAGLFSLKIKSGDIVSNTVEVTMRPGLELTQRTYQIVFHIVHDGESVGEGLNLSAERIAYQMQLLRSVFETENPVTPNSYLPKINFELATTDPEGNTMTEPGINRFQRPNQDASILFQDWMWAHYWDPDYYINVWVGDTKSGSSWGIYPKVTCQMDLIPDGIFCSDDENPDELTGIALEIDNLWEGNWVFPHEMGHVFGLFHIFPDHGGCQVDADFCDDTHQYDRSVYESGTTDSNRTSCEGTPFVSYNVMDYWNQPNGVRDLSYDQVKRIRTIVDFGRWRGSKSLNNGTPRNMLDVRNGG